MECLMIFPCHLPKTVKMNFSILFTWNFHKKKTAAKTKILPRAGEINFSILFDLFCKEKHCRQNQELAKSWKNPFLNTFLIEIWKKNCRQNQELEKSIYQYFFNWNLKRNTLPLKPRSCQKVEILQSSKEHGWLFLPRWEHSNLPGVPRNFEKHARKKPTDWKMECLMIFPCHLPKAGKNQYLFTCNFNRKNIAAKTKILTKTGKINFSILF